MSILPLIYAPDPRLKVISEPVETVDDRLRRLMDDMHATMREAPGIGLSAIQVGVPKRLIVVDVSPEDEPAAPLHLVNPEIVWYSDVGIVMNEGCLSLPEHFAEIERAEQVRVDYLDYRGEPASLEADGLLSRCIQHEFDHLDGILFVDHLSALKRNMILRKLVKAQRQKASA
jgi:peptide deformylase